MKKSKSAFLNFIKILTLSACSVYAAPRAPTTALNGMHVWGGWGVAATSAVDTVSGASTGGFSAGAEYWLNFRQFQYGLAISYVPVWRYDLSAQGINFTGSAAYMPILPGVRYFFFRGLYAAAGLGIAVGFSGGTTTAGTPITFAVEAGLQHAIRPQMGFQIFIRNYFFGTNPYINDFVPGVGFVWKF